MVFSDVARPPDRWTRAASLSSSSEDDAVGKKPMLALASPSPSRPSRRHALDPPPKRRSPARRCRPIRMFESMCRSLPVFNMNCGGAPRLHPGAAAAPPSPDTLLSQLTSPSPSPSVGLGSSSQRLTGTLFGYRNCRVSLALQDTARCVPDLVVELAIPTHVLLRELSSVGGARVVLESEKRPAASWRGGDHHHHHDEAWVLEEAMWTMFCGGKRVGYAVRREPNDVDVEVLETLWAVSMGGGVLSGIADVDGPDGEMAYLRGSFEHTVGSRDSESLYMVGPPGGECPELAIFFVRL